jgi:Acetyl/propionyl-CoA carboxylase, alpha subunit
VADGGFVGSDYDPMLSKVIAHGADRDEALRRLDAALRDTVLLGLGTNIGFLRALLADNDVRAARLDTGLVGRRVEDWTAQDRGDLPGDVLAAAALHAQLVLEPSAEIVDPFDVPGGWRVGEPAWAAWRMIAAGHPPVTVRVRGRAPDAEVAVGDAEPARAAARFAGGMLAVTLDGTTRRYTCAQDGDTLWLSRDGRAWGVREQEPLEAARHAEESAGGPVVSPMPGTVTVVEVADGQQVAAGDRLVVVEAMKMEHVLTSPVDGVVRDLRARAGATVARGATLLIVEPATEKD